MLDFRSYEDFYDDEDRGPGRPCQVIDLDWPKESPVSLLEEDKARIRETFASGVVPKGSQNPFMKLSESVMEMLVQEAFFAHPWATIEHLTLNIDGIDCPISYKVFYRAGRTEDLKRWHSKAIDAYLCTFDRVCELLSSEGMCQRYNGWARAREWWPEIIKRAFAQTPFVPLDKLCSVHNGKKIASPYEHVKKYGTESDVANIRAVYDEQFREYINESFDHAMEYACRVDFFSWKMVPEKWHKEFLRRCFESNPFGGADNGLKFTQGGRIIETPANHYRRLGRAGDFHKMMEEILREYVSSLSHAVQFVCHPNFNILGGWAVVTEKFKKIIVLNAILLAETPRPSVRGGLVFCQDGQSIKIDSLRRYYQKNGKIGIFEGYVKEGDELKARQAKDRADDRVVETRSRQKADLSKPKVASVPEKEKRDWVLPPVLDEEIVSIILESRNRNDLQLLFMAARRNGRLIVQLATRFAQGNQAVLDDLVSDGIEKTIECANLFNPNRGVKFVAYLYGALLRLFRLNSKIYLRGKSKAEVKHMNDTRYELRILSEDCSADYEMMDPQAISAITGRRVSVVMSHQGTMASRNVSIDRTKDSDSRPLKDCLRDENADPFAEASHHMAVAHIAESMETLSLREQVLLKQYYGLKGPGAITPGQLEKAFEGTLNVPMMSAAVAKFQERLRGFFNASDPAFKVAGVEKLTRLLTNSEPEATMNGTSEFGRFLLANTDSNLNNLFVHILLSMEEKEAIIVSELFNIPFHSHTLEKLGIVAGVTKERIRQILEKAYSLMEEPLGARLGMIV